MSKAHKLKRFVAEKVNNKPLLITEQSLHGITEYLENREDSYSPDAAIVSDESERTQIHMTDNLAVIPIHGSLTYEKSFMSALCGLTSYQQLLEDVELALSTGIKTVVFDVDSGGGEAYAMMSTAESIRNRLDKHGAKLITYVDGMSASAAYGLTAISDEVIAHPDSQVGSVGVVIRLVNDNEYQKKNGYKTTYITSANNKVPFDNEGDFKEGFLAKLQSDVDDLHSKFVNHVAGFRNMSFEDVDATQADVFKAEEAIEKGFVDSVMNHDQFFDYLAELEEGKNMPLFSFKKNSPKATVEGNNEGAELSAKIPTQEVNEEMQLEEMQNTLDKALAEKEEALSEVAKLKEELSTAAELLDSESAEKSELIKELSELKGLVEDKKLAERKSKLSSVLASDKVDSVFDAVKELPEEAFNSIVDSYKAQNEALESTDMFKETGFDKEANSDDVEEKTQAVMNFIKKNKKVK